MDRFPLCAAWLLDIEGFDSDDAADRGGATRWGISLRLLRSEPDRDHDGITDGDLNRDGVVDERDVRYVDKPTALRIYREEFWGECRCGDLPVGLDVAIFDAAVNSGQRYARRWLQSGLGVKIDGQIGPATLAAAQSANLTALIPDMLSHRAEFYADIVRSDSTQAKFERGWFRRLFLLQQFILRGAP